MSQNVSLRSLKILEQIKMPANSTFLEERDREERLPTNFLSLFLLRSYTRLFY